MKTSFIAFLTFTFSSILYGQNQIIADSIHFDKKIINYSIDTNGSIFLSFEGGGITKYSSKLDSLFSYSPSKVGDTKLIEAGNGLYIFAFYEFFQEYLLTNRFLAQPTRTSFSNSSIDYIDLATQSLDNNIWLIENTGFRLIKFNTALNMIEFETALNTIIETQENNFTFIKEYQNQLFLVDEKSGIYVFDNLGNFSKFIRASTNKCTFENNKVIYLEKEELVIVDIYSTKNERFIIKNKDTIGVMKHKSNTYYVAPTSLFRIN